MKLNQQQIQTILFIIKMRKMIHLKMILMIKYQKGQYLFKICLKMLNKS